MNSFAIQDILEPACEDRRSTFGSIDPVAVERALQITESIEAVREARLLISELADQNLDVEA